MQSHEIACRAGDAVSAATGIPVDVHEPTLRVGIEIATQATHVFAERRPAPGGLPAGVSGRAILLLSGGDRFSGGGMAGQPSAAWRKRRSPSTRRRLPARRRKTRSSHWPANWRLASGVDLWIAGFTEAQKRLRAAGRPELAVVLYRRMMVRVADLLCERARCDAIVTGENLGQVASQTLTNMHNIEVVGRHLILRPLLTYDKVETTALARRIGTYDISALPFEDCCSLFVPAHPATAARLLTSSAPRRRWTWPRKQQTSRSRLSESCCETPGAHDRGATAGRPYVRLWANAGGGREGARRPAVGRPRVAFERAEAAGPVEVVTRFTRPWP